MGLRNRLTKAYLKSPLRGLDTVVKNRGKIKSHVSKRREKGGKRVKKLISRVLNNPKKRRKNR